MLGVSDCVDMIVCGDDTNTEPKPSPYNALKICEALGVDPAEVQELSLITDRIRSMGEGYVFTGVCLFRGGGG